MSTASRELVLFIDSEARQVASRKKNPVNKTKKLPYIQYNGWHIYRPGSHTNLSKTKWSLVAPSLNNTGFGDYKTLEDAKKAAHLFTRKVNPENPTVKRIAPKATMELYVKTALLKDLRA